MVLNFAIIIVKNIYAKNATVAKYANIIEEKIVVVNVVINLNYAHIINKNQDVINAVVLKFANTKKENQDVKYAKICVFIII
tara:strand:- start:229 stop:474 length:246 start_codon:yes stop_codon:yes gene_type:complete